MPPSVLIAIVNYRTAALVADCLASLDFEVRAYGNAKVIIADNDSGDGSIDEIANTIDQRGFRSWASVIPLPRNGGFAYGNNAILAPLLESDVRPDYVLLLNPDTTIFPGLIERLVSLFQTHPRAGIVGAHQQDPDGTPLCSSFRFPTALSELSAGLRLGLVSRLLQAWEVATGIPESAVQCDWVSGGCMMIDIAVFDAIGLMDEDYFLYFEETDFCLRARRVGFECWFSPDAKINHLGGQSTKVTGIHRKPSRRPQYWFDSRRRYFLKNRGRASAAAADALFLAGFAAWRVRRSIQGQEDRDPPRFLGDFWKNSVFMRGFELASPRAPVRDSSFFERLLYDH